MPLLYRWLEDAKHPQRHQTCKRSLEKTYTVSMTVYDLAAEQSASPSQLLVKAVQQ